MDSGANSTGGMGADSAGVVRLVLALGFFGLTAGVLIAHGSPARGYELSIYAATPIGFWLGVATALLIGLLVSLSSTSSVHRGLATLLAGGGVLAIVGLPALRGYYYYGTDDALTHLGWAKDVQSGQIAATDLFYPGLHTLGVMVSNVSGYSINRGLLVAVLAFALVFMVFVPLSVNAVSSTPYSIVVGAFAGFLFTPVNHVAINYMDPHPISEAVLFTPLVLFLLIKYMKTPKRSFSGVGLLLGLSLVGVVLYHSMLAAMLLSFMGTIALAQFCYRWLVSDGDRLATRPIYGQTALLFVVFGLWNVRFEVVQRTTDLMAIAIGGVFAGEAGPGDVVGQRTGAVAGVGGSLLEVFTKLLLPSAILAVLAGVLVLYSLYHWHNPSLSIDRLLGVGLIGVGLYSIPFFLGDVSRLFFRNLGFLMAIVTVLGALAIVRAINFEPTIGMTGLPTRARAILVFGLAGMLVLSALVVFPSPYLYHSNAQVTQSHVTGYETAFEHQDPDVLFAGVRSGPQRFLQAVYGTESVPPEKARFGFYRAEGGVPGEALVDLPGHFETDRYVTLTTAEVQQEVDAYRELRYSRDQLAAIERQPGVNKVQANGEFALYYVSSDSSES